MSRSLRFIALGYAFFAALIISAHDVRPGYLELRETSANTCMMLWKMPLIGNSDIGAHPLLPENMHVEGSPSVQEANGWRAERSLVRSDGALAGTTIRIDGIGDALSDVLVRVVRMDGTEQTIRLSRSHDSFTIEASSSRAEVAQTYTVLGIEHILLGIDHLLFVLALLIIVKSGRRLIATVTAFTLAHSITLAAATLGIVHVPSPPVEAMIALSIMFVAAEIVHGHEGRPGLTARKPWIVAFTFGLLHGFGFAGALSEVGLPQQAIPTALLFFNVGVEIGQLSFIACVLGVSGAYRNAIARRTSLKTPSWAWRVPPYAIGGMAAFWVIQRVMLFYGNCSTRTFVGTVDPTFTNIGSRSFKLPVYFTWPSNVQSSE